MAKAANLLTLVPRRSREWRESDEGRVHVLVPRYGKTRTGRWFARWLGRPDHIEVRLDDVGSAVWKACDGSTAIGDIAGRLDSALGDDAPERLSRFFKELEKSRFIQWVERAG